MKKGMDSIGKRIAAMVLLISVTLSAAALLVGWRSYTANSNGLLTSIGENATRMLAAQLTPEEVDRYYETRTPDDRYRQIQKLMGDIVDTGLVKYLYVVHIEKTGFTYVFDSDAGDGPTPSSSLGRYEDLSFLPRETLARLVNGERIEPFSNYNESYGGWVMVISTPLYYEDGMLAGYICANVDMNQMVHDKRVFLLNTAVILGLLTCVLVGVSLYFAGRRITGPVRRLTAAVEAYEENDDPRALKDLKVESNDELGALTTAFKMLVAELRVSSLYEKEIVVRERQMDSELDIAREISGALLPKSLPERRGGYPFEVKGVLRPGESLTGTFYDYFLGGEGQLWVLVGSVPGEGISQVLYTAMARAILKSQLRSELSLEAAAAEANRQIHELSDTFCLSVFIGVLDSDTGRFSWVNAGGEAPLLLPSQEGLRQLRVLTYAPMGQSAHAAYQTQEVELRQGDRLLLRTGKPAEAPDGEAAFGHGLGSREARLGTLAQLLSQLSAARPGEAGSYALLGLEYSRRARTQAHLLLNANASGGPALRKFLREQMEANGFSARQTAEIVVLGDELFSLCCHQVAEDSRFLAECQVPEGRGVVCLRLKGEFQGRDPLRASLGTASRNGAAYLRKRCEQVLFAQGDGADTVTLVCRLTPSETGEGGT